jgi:hypothetical protein
MAARNESRNTMNTSHHFLNGHFVLSNEAKLFLYALASACMPFVAATALLLFDAS